MNSNQTIESNVEYLISSGAITRDEAELILLAELGEPYEISRSVEAPGLPSLRVKTSEKEIWFHHTSIPEEEANRHAASIPDDCGAIQIIGLGLGYLLRAAVKNKPNLKHAVLIELEPALVKETLSLFSLSDYPHINWTIWIGDLSDRNFEKYFRFITTPGLNRVITLAAPAFLELNAGFVERFQETVNFRIRHGRIIAQLVNSAPGPHEAAYFSRKLYNLPFPSSIRIEPTNLCNLRCKMCPTPDLPNDRKGIMKMELYERILRELREINPQKQYLIYLYLGGEPLMHNQIHEMIEFAVSFGFQTHLNTNATLLTPDMSEKLINSGLMTIILSFDDVPPREYERIRAGASHSKVYENIRAFLDIRSRLGKNTPAAAVSAMQFPTSEEEILNCERPPLTDEYSKLFDGLPVRVVTGWAHHWAGGFVSKVGKMYSPAQPEHYFPCMMLWTHMAIRWDGTVVPCCFDLQTEHPIGKFPENTLAEIWNGEAAMLLRQAHVCGRAGSVPLCAGCSGLHHSAKSMAGHFGSAATAYLKKFSAMSQ